MKNKLNLTVAAAGLLLAGLATGCHSGRAYQPGPVAGQAVGMGVGTVAGNVTGFGAGVVTGTASGVSRTFNPSYRVVRTWQTQTTADGRTIQVPYDILVDQQGRPVSFPAPTGNPAPPANAAATNAEPVPNPAPSQK